MTKKTWPWKDAEAKRTDNDEPQLDIIVYSRSDNAHHRFSVSARMSVGEFLDLALTHLARGEGGERVEALRRYYDPVLELQRRDGNRELAPEQSLLEAGLQDEVVCEIAARPRKERIMFCSYS